MPKWHLNDPGWILFLRFFCRHRRCIASRGERNDGFVVERSLAGFSFANNTKSVENKEKENLATSNLLRGIFVLKQRKMPFNVFDTSFQRNEKYYLRDEIFH